MVMISREAMTSVIGRGAPWCQIPSKNVISVEHPGFVKDIDNTILSLGGDAKMATFLHSQATERSLGLYLSPEDAFRKPIMSRLSATSNVALRISVPKRTGRKRKRGSSGPFTDVESDDQLCSLHGVKYMLRSLSDNPESSRIHAVGSVEESHRFRGLPDFQYTLASSCLAQKLKNSVLGADYETLKTFKLDTEAKGLGPHKDMIPPPSFSQTTVPYNYAYHQNPTVKLTHDDAGKQTSVNTALMPKISTQLVSFDVETVPSGPSLGSPPEESVDGRIRDIISRVREIMTERPIVTRRVLHNRLGKDVMYDLRYALQYIGYMFRSGPWRDTVIQYGLDPRTDPKWRIYQTMSFKIVIRDESKVWADGRTKWNRSVRASEVHAESHIFDGTKVTPDAKIWQACDVTDPMLRQILDNDALRSECEIRQDGWYNNGAWAKTRIIMRDKIGLLMAGITPASTDYARLCSIPDVIDRSNLHLATFTNNGTVKDQTLSSQIRQLAKSLEDMNKRYDHLGVFKVTGNGSALPDTEDADGEDTGDEDENEVLLEDATVEADEVEDAD